MSLQDGDLLVRQVEFNQGGAEFDLQPVALPFLTRRAFVVSAASPADQKASPQPLSVAKAPRHGPGPSPRNQRGAAVILRCRDILLPRPGLIASLLVHDTPLSRKSSACEVSQSTVGRGMSEVSLMVLVHDDGEPAFAGNMLTTVTRRTFPPANGESTPICRHSPTLRVYPVSDPLYG
jgi:hypothetical protein